MAFANRFRISSWLDDELLQLLIQDNRCGILDEFDLFLEEPNLGCVGDYDETDDSEHWDAFGLES